jgi:peptidoglycan/LPS O-acetylase OafA/YrhL
MLDGMRAIAVIMVVIVHAAGLAASHDAVPFPDVLAHFDLGVTIFFLISGFLLYRPFIAHRNGGPPQPRPVRYLRRRALRIIPAYWLVLTALTILPGFVGVSGSHGLEQYTFTFTLPFANGPDSCLHTYVCGLAQTWSLAVEVGFYLALPIWFLLSERLARGRSLRSWVSGEVAVLATLSIVSVILRADETGGPNSIVGATLIGYLTWFAAGMVLAIASVALETRKPPRWLALLSRPTLSWTAAVIVFAALCLYLPWETFPTSFGDRFVEHTGFALVAGLLMAPTVLGRNESGWLPRLLTNRVFAWLGLVSYGIFLWHLAIGMRFGAFSQHHLTFWPLLAVMLAITIPIAAASYYLLERPLLRFK